jgi:hypothetical protein
MDDSLEQKRRFANLLTHLADYYKSEISRAVLGIYWEGLKQYSYEAIEKACWAHTQSPDEAGRWMPRNSDIIKLMEGSTLDQALVAWSKVERAVRTIGQNQSVAFDDATIQRVIYDMGGWVKLCSCPAVEEFVFVGKEFQTRYRGMVIRSDRPEFPPYLTGFSEDQNSLEYRGQPIQVRAIGDVRQCWQVLKSGTLGGEALDNVQLLAPKAEIARIAGKSPLQLENSI